MKQMLRKVLLGGGHDSLLERGDKEHDVLQERASGDNNAIVT